MRMDHFCFVAQWELINITFISVRGETMKKLKAETIVLHGGHVPDPTTRSRAVPIYQTTSFVFADTDDAAGLFGLKPEVWAPRLNLARNFSSLVSCNVKSAKASNERSCDSKPFSWCLINTG